MNRTGIATLGAFVGSLLGPIPVRGQAVLGFAERAGAAACGVGDLLAERLRSAHPLGAAQEGPLRQCLDGSWTWVATAPLSPGQRDTWRRALGALGDSNRTACRASAAVLDRLERQGQVSVWVDVDTAGGMLYLGAAYLDHDDTPLAVQFWAPAFERSLEWFAAAAAHEAFHLLHPRASEADALAFGTECAAGVAPRAVRHAGGGR